MSLLLRAKELAKITTTAVLVKEPSPLRSASSHMAADGYLIDTNPRL